jgi:rubrerythrin
MTELLTRTVAVFGDNETRTDLYRLWLSECDVRTALTKRQADEIVDSMVGVAVIDETFADGAARKVLKLVRAETPVCRVVAIRPHSSVFPTFAVDHQLVKPVFEANLGEMVKDLLRRANYHLALRLYYRTALELAPLDFEDSDTDDEQYRELAKRADELKPILATLRQEMSDEDVTAVVRAVTVPDDIEEAEGTEQLNSKYQPKQCSQCGVEWTVSEDAGASIVRLAAHVWRCGDCGHVQMYTDPSHRRVNPS